MLMRKLYLFSRSAVKEEKLDSSRLRGNILFIHTFFEGGGGRGRNIDTSTPNHSVFFFIGREEHRCLYAKPETNFTSSIPHFRKEKAIGAEIRPAVVIGMVSRDVGRAGQPLGSFVPVTVPEVFAKANSSQFPFLRRRIRLIFRSCPN